MCFSFSWSWETAYISFNSGDFPSLQDLFCTDLYKSCCARLVISAVKSTINLYLSSQFVLSTHKLLLKNIKTNIIIVLGCSNNTSTHVLTNLAWALVSFGVLCNSCTLVCLAGLRWMVLYHLTFMFGVIPCAFNIDKGVVEGLVNLI